MGAAYMIKKITDELADQERQAKAIKENIDNKAAFGLDL